MIVRASELLGSLAYGPTRHSLARLSSAGQCDSAAKASWLHCNHMRKYVTVSLPRKPPPRYGRRVDRWPVRGRSSSHRFSNQLRGQDSSRYVTEGLEIIRDAQHRHVKSFLNGDKRPRAVTNDAPDAALFATNPIYPTLQLAMISSVICSRSSFEYRGYPLATRHRNHE